ncbi:unnamed protein product [Chondrus crispus]|uniref:Uncharacterized protein n=1 Tax=Chondrus crispus TaxID=2769 RepID=R7QFH2_CHOCR|nr:unnamed protein product [Chondrus crispus]CDF37282.1 unnamed protein product [Chondrus crispus]|eukprot:XP_005717101.1 unnamed protein product [Chondrus crispus]
MAAEKRETATAVVTAMKAQRWVAKEMMATPAKKTAKAMDATSIDDLNVRQVGSSCCEEGHPPIRHNGMFRRYRNGLPGGNNA